MDLYFENTVRLMAGPMWLYACVAHVGRTGKKYCSCVPSSDFNFFALFIILEPFTTAECINDLMLQTAMKTPPGQYIVIEVFTWLE